MVGHHGGLGRLSPSRALPLPPLVQPPPPLTPCPSPTPISEARDLEVKALHQLGMFDAYLEVHNNPVDAKYEPHEGFTCGFGVHDSSSSESDSDDERPPHNLRQIDRIHVSKSLLPHLSEALTAFIAKVDHKAVPVSCMPTEFDLASCRFRCPTEIL